jgi:hypothetical protein
MAAISKPKVVVLISLLATISASIDLKQVKRMKRRTTRRLAFIIKGRIIEAKKVSQWIGAQLHSSPPQMMLGVL